METPFQLLVKCYVHGIIRRVQGAMNPFETQQFSEARKAIKQGLQTFEWLLMSFDKHVVNVVMQMGDKFLADRNVEMALEFYREASHMFPDICICYIREAQCHVVLKCFHQAKSACRKAIRHSDDSDFNQLYSIIDDIFIENNRLPEAHDLYVILMDRFPHRCQVLQRVQELKVLLLRDKAEESKREIRNKKEKNASKGPSGRKKTTSKNIGQTSNEVAKTSKQLKREQMAKEKEIERNIEKASKEQEEKRKKREVEARKRKEREEEEEKLGKQEEVEARDRKEREGHEKKLDKQKNNEIEKEQGGTNKSVGKKSSKTSNGNKAMDTHATRSKNSSTNTVLSRKRSLNDMSTDFDKIILSGSQLRRVCSTCNTPRVFSYNQRYCHSCRSELVVWYKRVNTTSWVRPRMPPNQDIAGPYVQCKHFLQMKRCVKTRCAFAHGEDELKIWELCCVKEARQQAPHSRNEDFKELKTSVSSLPNSRSCMTLNDGDCGTGLRSRTESLRSLCSQSSSKSFDVLSTEDTMLNDFDSDSEYSSYFSQDRFDESSHDSVGCSTSFLSLDVDIDASTPMAEAQTTPVEPDESDDRWIEVGRRKKPQKIVSEELDRENRGKNKDKKKNKASSSATTISSQDFDTTALLVREQEKLRCEFCKITFSFMLELEYHYSDPQHKVNVMKNIQLFNAKSYTKFRPPSDGVYMGRYKLCRRFEQGYCYFGNKCIFAHGHEECTYWIASYQLQAQQLAQFQEKRLLTENFGENVCRRIKHEGEHRVLKENLPGVTVKCSSPLRVKLDGPKNHRWIFDVRIQTKYRVLLRQVAFLLETHLDKFKFLRNPGENCSSNMQSIRLLEMDFIENSGEQESAVQFCIQFSSDVFGDFQQKLVFDFGQGSVLARSLHVSVISKDIFSSKIEPSSRTTDCCILEWSVDKMELILCKDLIGLDLDGLCEQYNIPKKFHADPAESVEFTRSTYCKLWHDILFIEEQHIQMEVARYDIQNGAMKIVDSFQSIDETIFAPPGELFGEIYLSDFLVLDEVAGHLINRSVMSVILRPKVKHSQSNRVYECSIKLKTSQLVIIKLNEVLYKDYVFVKDQEIYIDIKFRYNRLPMCEMHQAIDMCKEKTKILLPSIKNVSYTDKKSIHDWFMDRKPNTNQHEAIAMILDPSPTPPILVIGPFGTGKTFTLSLACVSILSQQERREVNKVLICTHSNSAADIHLQYLDAKIAKKPLLNLRPLRVHNLLRKVRTIPEKLRKYCLIEETTNVIKGPSWKEIHDHNVIITTLTTARMLWKFYEDGRLRFTHILIDEAAQALEPECVTPLVMADGNTKIVLAGDHKQMGPQVYSKCLRAEHVGPKRSILERLFTYYKQCSITSSQPSFSLDYKSTFLQTPYLVLLTENYRCHAQILDFPSDCFYGGELVARGDQNTHELVPVLSFYAAQGVDNREEGSVAYYNDAEVAEVVKRVEELIHLWPKDWSKSIGVITPYRDQVKRIREGLRKKDLGYVDVDTVENVQGKEFKALFISTVRTMWTCSQIEGRNIHEDPSELDFAFLSNPRFLNTAVTRAQSLLAVIGDPMSLCSVGACRNLWKEYLQRCDANKGLYGCTSKTVMDFCLRSQALDASAHEFTPNKTVQDKKDETLTTTPSKGDPKVSSEENSIEIEVGSSSKAFETDLDYSSILHGPSSTTMANQTIQPVSPSIVSGQVPGKVQGIQVDREADLAEDYQTNRNENVSNKDENKDEDDSKIIETATDNFFSRDGIQDIIIIDKIIKACQETKKKDEACQETKTKDVCFQQNPTAEEFPSLSDVSQAPSTPHWSNVSISRTFSAGLRDSRIELGFHVKDSERLFRLTGGKLLLKENGDNQSCYDIDAFPQEELLKLLKGSPTLFTKCSFRIDTSSRQLRYCGQLPTPDSPDIHIPGKVRRVYEDDVVVLELLPSARARDEKEHKQEVKIFGYIKGVLRRLIEPEERQFVCTVDRASPGVMIPINKNSPKLMNFTKTDENIIPIYLMKDKEVTRATILSKKHYDEALTGERVFVVKYLKWRPDCPYPLGLAIRHIPHGSDFKTGMEILYEEYNIKREFDKLHIGVKREFDENWQIPVSEKGRHVYRDNVFTIDPPESLDLDDAISIRSIGNGNYELHIHIADVSYFVQPNKPLDEEARSRGTSYYPPKPKETVPMPKESVPMPKETVPMLPRKLSENCCSLLKGKDRLALTLSVEVTPDGTVVNDARIERSVVRSSSRLTYLQAQKFIDETSQIEVLINGEEKQIPVEEAIGVVHRIAQERRRLRLGLGRALYERKRDDFDDDHDNEREAHQMIEEIMIMANHLVAKYLLKKFPNCTPLRVQPPPKTRRVVEWRQRFQKFVNFSLGLEWLGDKEIAQEEKIGLKVPFTTWIRIISEVRQNSNFEVLVKLVCDLDLFPQLALANVHQQLLQQRGQYICSGETFENIPFPWPQHNKETSTDKENVHDDVSSNSPIEIASFPEDNESISEDNTDQKLTNSGDTETDDTEIDGTDDRPVSSSGSGNEGVQSSANVSNQRELNKILYGHASLCLDAYCHFTSPIRRYMDIIVHRLVVASIENRANFMNSDDITTLCDRCTFFARNSRRFDKNAKKLRLAVSLQSSMRFVSAFIDEVAPDALKLFFGTGELKLLRDKSVRIARLGPDKDPEEVDDHIKLQWTFRFLRLDKHENAQPKLHISDDEKSQDLANKLERQTEVLTDEEPKNSSEVSDDDFDYTVSSEHWNGVLEAVKNQDEDELKSRLQEVDNDVQKQGKPENSTKIFLVKKMKNNPSLSSNAPYQHPNTDKPESSEKETYEFLKVIKSFKPYDRVEVQICSQMTRGVLSPTIQLFKLTDKLHACIEHRSFPTACFAKTSYNRPTNTEVSDITQYVKIWKPVLMMEIATSAVLKDDVITLSNLRVSFAQDSKGLVTMEFDLSNAYIRNHDLDPLDLDLMCVRVKDPDGSGKVTGYWVGHFQISEELGKKEVARKITEEAEKNSNTMKDQTVQPDEAELKSSTPFSELQGTKKAKEKATKNTSAKEEQDDWRTLAGSNPPSPVPGFQDEKKINNETKTKPKKDQSEFRPVLARLIHSSTPVPESLITQRYCYVTVELIMLSIPDRRRLGALVHSVEASELVQNICIGKVSTELLVEGELPKNLSLCNVHHTLQDFYPLNEYQRNAVQEALAKSFTLIQGPPGTGKTVTGVHIAYWFAQLNQKMVPTVEKEGEACKGSMVFYCGPSNKSVDVVARYLMKIPDLKILRIYGQEIERKVFPVPDKVTLFRSKRVPVQLKADEDLKDVSLHHVIRSAECPFAKTLKIYDEKFKEYTRYNFNAPHKMIDAFNEVKSDAEKWAITQRGVNVILVTCTTSYSPRILVPCKGFVCQCIIDECGMCIEADTLCAMLGSNAKQVVLIGDHKQLQPVIKCDKAKERGLGISMFERFSERAQMLEIQYRMHQELCQFPSEFFYDGKLQTAKQVLDRRPDNVKWLGGDRYPFVFHHVEGIEESLIVATDQGNENSKKNQKEISKVVHVARRLNNEGIKGDDIVVLSPYRAQCFEITEKLKQHGLNDISVMSVVAAQGSEKNYVILSLVRSVPEREIEKNPSRSWLMEHLGFLTDEHQINVALTRAKRGLCIVGNANLIGICSMWRALLKHYESKGCLKMDA